MAYPAQLENRAAARDLISQIGNTPLLRLQQITRNLPPAVEIYAKAEWFNPGGSVKDRPALNMILEGERSGKLGPGRVLLDATSGNTGIAYAMIAAARGHKVRLCISSSVSAERKQLMQAYGADLIFTDPSEHSDGAIRKARELYGESPDLYYYPDQYNSDANWRAHYETTAVEIYRQTGGRITHFIAGLGTSGTFIGTTRRLKELKPLVQAISFQPDSGFHGLEGLKHMATAIVPGIYDPRIADRDMLVGTEEAYQMARRMAREEGLLVGVSSAAAMSCALRVASEIDRGVIVTVFPDSGERYLGNPFWAE